jgi:hypothetical protein
LKGATKKSRIVKKNEIKNQENNGWRLCIEMDEK